MSNIKIQEVDQRIQYEATAGQTEFAVPFPFFTNSDLVVYKDDTLLAITTDYTVIGAGSPSGGEVTLIVAASAGDIITIQGNMPIDRTSIYSATISNLTGSDLNGDFNREVVMMKQIETTQDLLQLQYKPYLEVSQDVSVTKDRWLPLLPNRGAWRMNPAGTEIETFAVPDGDIAPAAATYIIQTPNAFLPNAQALDSLANGIVYNTSATGVLGVRTITGTASQIDVLNGTGVTGNPTISISDNAQIGGTTGIAIPSGTTAQRVVPTAPNIALRFNTTIERMEYYDHDQADWAQLENDSDILALVARLAAHTTGDGASMIGLENQGSVSNKTVQDLAEADFIVKTDTNSLANGFALSTLATGVLVNETATGNLVSRTLAGKSDQIVITNGTGLSGNPTFAIADNPTIPGTAGINIPVGTTAQRVTPSSPDVSLRFNTDTDAVEYYDHPTTSWVSLPSSATGIYLEITGGTMAGTIDMDSNTIINLPSPTLDSEPATKKYTDDLTAVLADGELMIGRTGLPPVANNLTAGSGISIAEAPGSITISGIASSIGWTEVTGTTEAMSADSGYIASNAGLVTLTLPTTAAVGTLLQVVGKGAGGWQIDQNAGQQIHVGNASTTAGAGGSIASTHRRDAISLVCTTADTSWTAQAGIQGILDIT